MAQGPVCEARSIWRLGLQIVGTSIGSGGYQMLDGYAIARTSGVGLLSIGQNLKYP